MRSPGVGRTAPLKPYEAVNWAKRMASATDLQPNRLSPSEIRRGMTPKTRLTQLEAHVLVLLAIYADEHGYCYPGIKRLAEDMTLSVKTVTSVRKGKDGKPRQHVSHQNTAVSAALQNLEDHGLISSKRRFNTSTLRRLHVPEGNSVTTDDQSSVLTDDQSSALTEPNFQGEQPGCLPAAPPSSPSVSETAENDQGDTSVTTDVRLAPLDEDEGIADRDPPPLDDDDLTEDAKRFLRLRLNKIGADGRSTTKTEREAA